MRRWAAACSLSSAYADADSFYGVRFTPAQARPIKTKADYLREREQAADNLVAIQRFLATAAQDLDAAKERQSKQFQSQAKPIKEEIYQAGGLVINDDTKEVTVDGAEVRLTPTEYRILALLTANAGRVYTIYQIYDAVWEEPAFNPENTVAVHIRHIREKIEINPKEPRYLKVVWGVGYKVEKIG